MTQESKRKEELRKLRSLERQRAVEGKSTDTSPTKSRGGKEVSAEGSLASAADTASGKGSKLGARGKTGSTASLSGNSVDSAGSGGKCGVCLVVFDGGM